MWSGEECSQEHDKMVKEVIQAVIALDYSKKPFKYSDILTRMTEKPRKKDLKTVFDLAKIKLKGLGLELVETRNTSVKLLFVVSKHKTPDFMYKYADEMELSTRTLLALVLSYIFMKNGTVHSEELFNFLKALKISVDPDKPHQYFGDVKKIILQDFVNQLYLTSTKIADTEVFEIGWGERANVEVNKLSILKFVCQCAFGGKLKPESLTSHYERAVQEPEQDSSNADDSNDIEVID